MRPRNDLGVVRTKFWLGELQLHHGVRAEQSRFRAGAGLRRLEYALREEEGQALEGFNPQSLKRYANGQRACRDNGGSLIELADARFPGTARSFRSPLWLALGDTLPSRVQVEAKAKAADWSPFWEMTRTDVDMLVHFDDVDALGCLLLDIALCDDRTNIALFANSELTSSWFRKNWSRERLAQDHVQSVVALIRKTFYGRLILPADITVSPRSSFALLDWA